MPHRHAKLLPRSKDAQISEPQRLGPQRKDLDALSGAGQSAPGNLDIDALERFIKSGRTRRENSRTAANRVK